MSYSLKLIAIFLFIFSFLSCKKENDVSFSSERPLSFSDDTVKFDTVFTTVGSTTRRVKIFNRSKDDLQISNIRLAGGEKSPYQININGIAANTLKNFKIRGRDSINLFIRVNINPTDLETPFIVSDSISFTTNGKEQIVQLEAYGQNAHFLHSTIISTNTFWNKNLPYVVYDSLVVREGARLTLLSGSKLYFHKGAKMLVAGSLRIEGTAEDSVILTSDRKEKIYSEVPGQWQGLLFKKSSSGNLINHALIKNCLTALSIDGGAPDGSPKLTLVNSMVKNMDVAGIVGSNTYIVAFNNLFANCGRHLIYCIGGGEYNFKQNTFANYFNYSTRTTPSLSFSDYLSENPPGALKLTLVNNIVWGNQLDELLIEKKGQSSVEIIRSNLIRSKDKNLNGTTNLLNTDPLFRDVMRLDFRLLNNSSAVNKGEDLSKDTDYQTWLNRDKDGSPRQFPSELGCYEIF